MFYNSAGVEVVSLLPSVVVTITLLILFRTREYTPLSAHFISLTFNAYTRFIDGRSPSNTYAPTVTVGNCLMLNLQVLLKPDFWQSK